MNFFVKNKSRTSGDVRNLGGGANFRLLFGIVVSIASVQPAGAQPSIFIKQAEIDAIKLKIDAGEAPWTDAYNTVLSRAGTALNTPLQSVTFQGETSHRNPNIFYTFEGNQGDQTAAILMSDSVRTLGLAYAFTGQSQYADKAIQLINTWAVSPATRMRPMLGKTIQGYVTMPSLFYGADLVSNYDGWDPTEKADFYSWTQSLGNTVKANGEGNNNFSNWRTVMLSTAGALINDDTMLDLSESEFKRLLPIQVQNAGSNVAGRMNQEYDRDDGLHYSLFAINAMIQTAEILHNRGVNVYDYVDPNTGSSLKLALDFITPFALNPETWGNTPETRGYTQETTIAQRHSMAMFELAYSYYQDPAYLAVINRWERPMYENRIMGITTLTHANTFELAIAPVLDGDFDLDSDVDGADFIEWQRGGLGASDFAAWEANFGTVANPLAASATTVPEPNALLLGALSVSGLLIFRKRQRR